MSKNTAKVFTAWWVVASNRDPKHGWHWDHFFKEYNNPVQYFDWGGPDWINSTVSFARIRQMRSNDIVVAYQAAEGIVGLARLGSEGYMHEDSMHYDSFDLRPQPHVALKATVPYEEVREYQRAAQHIEFVWAGFKSGSVFGVTEQGLGIVIDLAKRFNPSQRNQIDKFIKSV